EQRALLPVHARPLVQVFPVLHGVDAIAGAPPASAAVRDAQELRSRAFAAVRELLLRLARRRPLVLVIDDMQWSDADSLALLRDLVRPPDAPPLLLLMTVRTSEEAPDADFMAMPGDVAHLSLAHLLPAESREL